MGLEIAVVSDRGINCIDFIKSQDEKLRQRGYKYYVDKYDNEYFIFGNGDYPRLRGRRFDQVIFLLTDIDIEHVIVDYISYGLCFSSVPEPYNVQIVRW